MRRCLESDRALRRQELGQFCGSFEKRSDRRNKADRPEKFAALQPVWQFLTTTALDFSLIHPGFPYGPPLA